MSRRKDKTGKGKFTAEDCEMPSSSQSHSDDPMDFESESTETEERYQTEETQHTATTNIPASNSASSTGESKDVMYKDLLACLKKGRKGESWSEQVQRCKEYIRTEFGPIHTDSEKIVDTKCTSFVKKFRESFRAHSKSFAKVEEAMQEKLKSKFSIVCVAESRPSTELREQNVESEDLSLRSPSPGTSSQDMETEDNVTSESIQGISSQDMETEVNVTSESVPGTSTKCLPPTPPSTKFRRIASAAKKLHEYSPGTLVKVAAHNIQLSGKHKEARRVRDSIKPEQEPAATKKPVMMTPEEALCLLLDLHLSTDQYKKLRQNAEAHDGQIWPAYEHVLAAKKACRPSTSFEVDQGSAKVSLQSLLNHTASRVVKKLTEGSPVDFPSQLKMQCSWGFDGSTGQAVYKQPIDPKWDTSSLFTTHVIPLQLIDLSGSCIWRNPSPQSVRYCRPLRLMFVKETTEISQDEKKRVQDEIRNLQSFATSFQDRSITITYEMVLTLIDGKVLNAITGTKSPLTCPICKRSISTFNQIEARKQDKVDPEKLQHGLSPLHAWIRCFEFILHISYRLPVKKWRVSHANDKAMVKKEKTRIQNLFKQRMGLLVDIPKTGGSGTTNDGNTSRRAFANAEVFSEITNVDLQLIKDLRTILIAINCNLQIDEQKFDSFCNNVGKRYTSLYDWCHMTTTVHKILVHGGRIIQNSIVPIGMLGEEASEGRNKYYKYNRLHHARKDSPVHTMTDVFWRAMDHSDPYLSSYETAYNKRKRNRKPLPTEVINLLKEPDVLAEGSEDACKILQKFSEEYAIELDNELDQEEEL